MSGPCCTLVDIVKAYRAPAGPVRAIDGISLDIRAGEILCLLGPNGAGKSTLVNVAASLAEPDSGQIERKGVLGLCEQPTMVWEAFSPREQLSYMASMRGMGAGAGKSRSLELAGSLGFADCMDRRADSLSGGERRKLHIALCLIHSPNLLIMDEPEVGLDSASRMGLRAFLRAQAASGAAILLATHDLSMAEKAADRVAIMDRGRLIAIGSPEELKRNVFGGGIGDLEDLFFSLTGKAESP